MYLKVVQSKLQSVVQRPHHLHCRHTSRFLVIWLAFLPFTLWRACHWAMVPAAVLIAFLLLGVEEIGVQIEEPFGILPLGAPATFLINWAASVGQGDFCAQRLVQRLEYSEVELCQIWCLCHCADPVLIVCWREMMSCGWRVVACHRHPRICCCQFVSWVQHEFACS